MVCLLNGSSSYRLSQWLKDKLGESRAQWKIALAHHPLYTKSSGHGASGDELRENYFYDYWGKKKKGYNLEQIFVEGGVDAYFAGLYAPTTLSERPKGHEHAMQHVCANKVNHFVCGASGADMNRYYPNVDPSRHMDWNQTDLTQHGFVAVEVTPTKMKVQFISNKLDVMHTVEIVK